LFRAQANPPNERIEGKMSSYLGRNSIWVQQFPVMWL
jgi:hypothetical protein